MTISRFDPSQHYSLGYDDHSKGFFIKPKKAGLDLAAKYYKNKYGMDIEIVYAGENENLTYDGQDPNFNEKIAEKVASDLINGKIKHKLYIFEMNGEWHGTPILAVDDGRSKSIYVADAWIGPHFNIDVGKRIGEKLSQSKNEDSIKIYPIDDSWQRDAYSCHLFGFIYARELYFDTKPPVTRDQSQSNVIPIKLPKNLVSSGQASEYFKNVKDDDVMHKGKKFKLFKDEHFIQDDTGRDVNAYPREKSLAIADRMEIQFYLDQLKNRYAQFDKKWENWFVNAAKSILESQEWNNNSFNKYSEGIPVQREGIYELTRHVASYFDMRKDPKLHKFIIDQDLTGFVAKNFDQNNRSNIFTACEFLTEIIQNIDAWKVSGIFSRGRKISTEDGVTVKVSNCIAEMYLLLKKSPDWIDSFSNANKLLGELKVIAGKYLFDVKDKNIKLLCGAISNYKGNISEMLINLQGLKQTNLKSISIFKNAEQIEQSTIDLPQISEEADLLQRLIQNIKKRDLANPGFIKDYFSCRDEIQKEMLKMFILHNKVGEFLNSVESNYNSLNLSQETVQKLRKNASALNDQMDMGQVAFRDARGVIDYLKEEMAKVNKPKLNF